MAITPIAALACSAELRGVDSPDPDAGPDAPDGTTNGPCAARILYVSPLGDDKNDGCTQAAPKKTLAATLGYAAAAKLGGYAIQMCAGTYREPALRLTMPISIRGGYDCQTWQRDANFGKAGAFETTSVTRIENGDYAAKKETFIVSGAAITKDVVLEGLTFVGADTGTVGSVALHIEEGATPVVTDSEILGGGTSSPAIGSIGLLVGKAAPEIKDCSIKGGSGTGVVGSIGVLVNDGAGTIHDTTVTTGTGRGTAQGGLGIHVDGTTSLVLGVSKNTIRLENAISTDPLGHPAIGISLLGRSADVFDNVVVGGQTRAEGASSSTIGIATSLGGTPNIQRNRIYVGEIATPALASLVGVWIERTSALVANNVIHTGGGATLPSMNHMGVYVLDGRDVRVVGNTVLAGIGQANAASRIGLFAQASQAGTSSGLVVEANVFMGIGIAGTDVGIQRNTCRAETATSVSLNLFLAEGAAYVEYAGVECKEATSYARVADMQQRLAAGATTAAGNQEVFPGGGLCSSLDECALKVFETFTRPGREAALVPNGYVLSKSVRCAIAQGGGAPLSEATRDVYGRPRTSPMSIGAAESDTCQP